MHEEDVGVSRVVRVVILLLAVHVGSGIASAQSPELVTDRPDKTEAPTVVLRGMVQVETGYLFDGDVNRYEVPGTLFRIGLGRQTELRIGHAGMAVGEENHGVGDSALGVKVNLIERADGWRPELSILGGLSIPTGDEGFSSDHIDPSFLVSLAYELSPRLSLGSNVGIAWGSSSDDIDRGAAIVYSLVLGSGLTNRLSVFLEVFGDRQTTSASATSVSVDGGFTFLLTDLVQLDAYVGHDLRGLTDDVFIGTGLSFRMPR